jgi:hypothetical protein
MLVHIVQRMKVRKDHSMICKEEVLVRKSRPGHGRSLLLKPYKVSKKIKVLCYDEVTGETFITFTENPNLTYVFGNEFYGMAILNWIREQIGESVNFKLTGFPDAKNPVQLKMF